MRPREFLGRLSARWRRADLERQLAEDIQAHIELHARDLENAGLSKDEALTAARRNVGNATTLRQDSRAAWGFPGAEDIMQDIRRAIRGFLRQPGFALAALLTLALGIGANVAVFAVFEAILLRPLPYSTAGELVTINHRLRETGVTKDFIASADFYDFAQRQTTLRQLVAFGGGQTTLTEPEGTIRVSLLAAGHGLFEALEARPALGRAFTEDDVRQGAPPVVMLGHEFWTRHFRGDSSVIGRMLPLTPQRQIVGVAPPGLSFPPGASADLIIPAGVPVAPANRPGGWILAMGRLKPGVSAEAAQEEFSRLARGFEEEFPATNRGTEYFVLPLRDAIVGPTRPALLMLLAAVSLVMLIACANVSNLLLVRSLGRQREFAVMQALGAGRGRLLSQLLAESLVLSVAAAVAGTLVAHLGARALVQLIPEQDSIPALQNVGINGTVLAFALGAAVLAALLSCVQSVLRFGGGDFAPLLVASRGTSFGRGARRASSALIVTEVALAIVLLVGAGLMLRTFRELIAVDPGFERRGVQLVNVALPGARYPAAEPRRALLDNAGAALMRLPGVTEVGHGIVVPLTGNNWTAPLDRVDQPMPEGQRPPDVGWQSASAGFFRSLRIPLVAGRLFEPTDVPGGPQVVIVSESVQRRYFAGSAVGKMLRFGPTQAEIVGVVGDIRRASLDDVPRADMYFPFEQGPQNQFTLFLRASGDTEALLAGVRSALRELEPGAIVDNARTMDAVAAEDTQVRRLLLWLLGVFALVALGLAAIGLYGVMSHVVRLRTREIGTRVALGATRAGILKLVMRDGLTLAVAGVVIGAGVGLLAVRLLRSMLYGVSPGDPWSLLVAAGAMLATAFVACYLPARRAASIDPARTLSSEG